MSPEPQRSASRGQVFHPNRQDHLTFVSSDPNNARSEAGLGGGLDVRVRPCRVDSREDGIHRHRRIPFLDLREHYSARGVAGVHDEALPVAADRTTHGPGVGECFIHVYATGVGRTSALTPRELQIAQLLASGVAIPEIAARLGRSKRTIEVRLIVIAEKLEVGTRAEVVAIVRSELSEGKP